MNKKVSIIVGIIITLVVIGYGAFKLLESQNTYEGNLTISHELGSTKVKQNPKNVVVFDFGVLDVLDYLDVDVVGLPKSSTVPSYLSKYNDDKYTNVGSLKDPNYIKISELKPELIIISTRQADLYNKFMEIAPTICLTLDEKDYLSSFEENVNTLGTIFNKKDKADNEISKIKQKIQTLKEKTTNKGLSALIVLTSSGDLSAYGPESRFGIIHKEYGVPPVNKNIVSSTHGQNITFEYIRDNNPDIIFVIDKGTVVSGGIPSKDLIENDLVASTKAAKNNRIYNLNAEIWYLSAGGITSTNKMIDEVSSKFID